MTIPRRPRSLVVPLSTFLVYEDNIGQCGNDIMLRKAYRLGLVAAPDRARAARLGGSTTVDVAGHGRGHGERGESKDEGGEEAHG